MEQNIIKISLAYDPVTAYLYLLLIFINFFHVSMLYPRDGYRLCGLIK